MTDTIGFCFLIMRSWWINGRMVDALSLHDSIIRLILSDFVFNHVLLEKPIGSVDDDKDGVVDLFKMMMMHQ